MLATSRLVLPPLLFFFYLLLSLFYFHYTNTLKQRDLRKTRLQHRAMIRCVVVYFTFFLSDGTGMLLCFFFLWTSGGGWRGCTGIGMRLRLSFEQEDESQEGVCHGCMREGGAMCTRGHRDVGRDDAHEGDEGVRGA